MLALAILLVAWLVVKTCQRTASPGTEETTSQTATARGLNRYPDRINYSKHARCRMGCRHISEEEVEDILQNGTVNYKKSDIGNRPACQRKYAVEGKTHDGQRVRIIFAPCRAEVTVVTVIDLGQEWECDCN